MVNAAGSIPTADEPVGMAQHAPPFAIETGAFHFQLGGAWCSRRSQETKNVFEFQRTRPLLYAESVSRAQDRFQSPVAFENDFFGVRESADVLYGECRHTRLSRRVGHRARRMPSQLAPVLARLNSAEVGEILLDEDDVGVFTLEKSFHISIGFVERALQALARRVLVEAERFRQEILPLKQQLGELTVN